MGKGQESITKNLIFTVLASAFGGGFTLGFASSALNGPQNIILNWIRSVKCVRLGGSFGHANHTANDSELWLWCQALEKHEEPYMLEKNAVLNIIWAVCSSSVCAGATVWCFVAPLGIKYIGVKKSLMLGIALLGIGSVIAACGPWFSAWECLLIGRIVLGIGTAQATVINPTYMTEISPPNFRGAAGTMFGLFFIMGLLAVTGSAFPQVLGNEWGWPYHVGLGVVPVIISIVLLSFCPDSPRYLYNAHSDKEAAIKALQWLRNTPHVQREMEEILAESQSAQREKSVGISGLFRNKFLRKICLLTAIPMIVNQFSGFFCIAFYGNSIFAEVGLDEMQVNYAMLVLWTCFLITCLSFLLLVDRVGRRVLLVVSQSGMIVVLSTFVLFVTLREQGYPIWTSYVSASCLLVFIIFFQLGCANLPWIVTSELFPQEARGAALGLAAAISWASATIITLIFPIFMVWFKQYTFFLFIIIILLGTIFIVKKLPETRGKSLEHIQAKLRGRQNVATY